MKNNYFLIILKAMMIIVIAGCKKEKEKEVNYYPDCFANKTNSAALGGASCADILVTIQLDQHRLVSINLDAEALHLKTNCTSYQIESNTNSIKINYYTFANHPDSIYVSACDDVMYPASMHGHVTTWKAVSGMLTAAVSRDLSDLKPDERYNASLELDHVKFIKENSSQDTMIYNLVIKDRDVGYLVP